MKNPANIEAWLDRAPAGVVEKTRELLAEVERLRGERTIYPAQQNILNALAYTGPEDVRAVILGQDPYHGPGQAMGLAFSVPPGQRSHPACATSSRSSRPTWGAPHPKAATSRPGRSAVCCCLTPCLRCGGTPQGRTPNWVGRASPAGWCRSALHCRSPWCFSPGGVPAC